MQCRCATFLSDSSDACTYKRKTGRSSGGLKKWQKHSSNAVNKDKSIVSQSKGLESQADQEVVSMVLPFFGDGIPCCQICR